MIRLCAACNVPVGIGACAACREFAWSAIVASQLPKNTPADEKMFTLALSVGMGAASEIVRRKWGQQYAQCVDDYIANFDRKTAQGMETAAADETAQQAQPEG